MHKAWSYSTVTEPPCTRPSAWLTGTGWSPSKPFRALYKTWPVKITYSIFPANCKLRDCKNNACFPFLSVTLRSLREFVSLKIKPFRSTTQCNLTFHLYLPMIYQHNYLRLPLHLKITITFRASWIFKTLSLICKLILTLDEGIRWAGEGGVWPGPGPDSSF